VKCYKINKKYQAQEAKASDINAESRTEMSGQIKKLID
jgi:hypothetical protein